MEEIVDQRVKRRRGEWAAHRCYRNALENGKIVQKIETREVEVLAKTKEYAMVRRKGCMPYIVCVRDLIPCVEH